MTLGPENHDRDAAGLRYVYPVVSRRSGGVSVGINLNPNNACNWRCVYCQVPGLVRGKAPTIDLAELARELRSLLEPIVRGDWLARHAPEGARRLNDVAFSGNGEPTSAREFPAAVTLARRVLEELAIADETELVLITNGSLVQREDVQEGLRELARGRGQVWFKVDRATDEGMRAVNDAAPGMERVRANLRTACALAPTWVQTCLFARDGAPPDEKELDALVEFLASEVGPRGPRGVLLYGLARPSQQPEAASLSRLPGEWLEAFAARLRTRGLVTRVFP
jgi:wyosine [tRNA(Phe)-imidazoG37] synthetase (radical SAM superfamily)